jgi:hypothetical protein
MKYVGETSQSLRNRVNGHKSSIRREKDTLLYQHFRTDDAHRSRNIEDLIEVQILEKVYNVDLDVQVDKKLTERRLLREYFWMVTLFTIYPYGLNDKVKGFGSVWSNSETSEKFNHHRAFKSIHIFVGKDRNRKKRKLMARNNSSHVDELYRRLENSEFRDTVDIRHGFQSLNYKVRNAVLRDYRFQNLSDVNKLMLHKWKDFRLTERNEGLFDRKVDVRKRFMIKLKFESKWMEKIYLSSILNNKEVKGFIPSSCQLKESPVVVYTYNRNIGSYILNHSRVLKELQLERFSSIEELD